MPPNTSNVKSEYKKTTKLDLDKLKNCDIQNAKVDLTKVNIRKLAKIIGVLSEYVNMYTYLFNSKRYYAVNDRTINLLMKNKTDMSATTSETAEAISNSDKEVVYLIVNETEAELFIVYKNKTRAGVSCFPYLNITIYALSKYCMFKPVDRNNYKHNCVYLALESGGLSVIELQESILSLRNRHIHKCELENICNTL